MEKAANEDKHDLGVYIHSEKSELAQNVNVDHWTILLLNEIEWFQFQGIFEQAAFHARGNKILPNSLFKLFCMFSIRP